MTPSSIAERDIVTSNTDRVWSGSLAIGGDKPLPLAGNAAHRGFGEPCGGCLEANWLAIETGPQRLVAVLAVDALFSSATFEADIEKALGEHDIALDGLWVVASHSHFAPQLAPEFPRLGRCERGHIHQTAGAIVNAIIAARQGQDGRKLATIEAGQAKALGAACSRKKGLVISRRSPYLALTTALRPNTSVTIPRALRLWCLRAGDGAPLAVLAHWPCHAVASAPVNRMSSAHVGAVRTTLRRALGETLPVIWLPGCSGDIGPYFPAPWHARFKPSSTDLQAEFGPNTPSVIAKFHQGLTNATKRALAALAPLADDRQRLQGSPTGLPLTHATAQRALLPKVQLVVRDLRLGPLRLVGFNAEPSFAWTQHLGFADDDPKVAVTGYVGPVFGHLPTPEQVPQGGYEVDGFRHAFGFEGDWRNAPDLRRLVCEAVACLDRQPGIQQ